MAATLPQLDITLSNYGAFRSPPTSPVRTYEMQSPLRDAKMDTPSGNEFVEWTPELKNSGAADFFMDSATSVGSASLPPSPILRLADDLELPVRVFEEWTPGCTTPKMPDLDISTLEDDWNAEAGHE